MVDGRGKEKERNNARNVLHCLEARELVKQSELLSRCKVHGCFNGDSYLPSACLGLSIFYHVKVTFSPSPKEPSREKVKIISF